MTKDELKDWLLEVANRAAKLPTTTPTAYTGEVHYQRSAATAWLAEARTALAAGFRPADAVRLQAESAMKRLEKNAGARTLSLAIREVHGALTAALRLIAAGRLDSLIDGVRAETATEVLEQAGVLKRAKHLAAAAVLAGGALETHLHSLVEKYGLKVRGNGSITKYDTAIARARNEGTCTVYDGATGHQVRAWGALRNSAAHKPGEFAPSAAEVQRMFDGVRDFIRQTT